MTIKRIYCKIIYNEDGDIMKMEYGSLPEEEHSIDLFELFNVIRKQLIWIVAFAMLGANIAYAYSSFIVEPTYQATAVVYVDNRKDNIYTESISVNELTAQSRLVPTYQTIALTRTAMQRAIDEADLEGYTPEQLLGMVSTTSDEDTGVFYITATGTDQLYVAEIANAVAEVGTQEIKNYAEGTTVNIIDYATVPESKSAPSNSRNAILGFMLGAIASAGVFILQSFLDVRLKKSEDFAKALEAPVLGIIPDILGGQSHSNKKNNSKQGGRKV